MIFYRGTNKKIENFSNQFVSNGNENDEEGPGIYFTNDFKDAGRYGDFIYKVDLKPKTVVTKDEKQTYSIAKIMQFIKSAPDWEGTAQNWDEDPNNGLRKAAYAIQEAEQSRAGILQQIWHDFFRYNPMDYIKMCINNNISMLLSDKPLSIWTDETVGLQHAIVYDPKIINILEITEVPTIKQENFNLRKFIKNVIVENFENKQQNIREINFEPELIFTASRSQG